jgi:hypothetical protein
VLDRIWWLLLPGLLLLGCPIAGCSAPSRIQAGAARVEITPPVPTPYNLGVEEIAHGIADPLYARIVYLEDDDDRVLLIAVDWEGLLRTAHDAVREAVSGSTGLPMERIVVNASHTHNAMWTNLDTEALLAEWGYHLVDRQYFHSAVETIAAAAVRAIASKQPARLSAGSGVLRDFSVNHRTVYVKPEDRARFNRDRRYPIGITDPTLGLVRIDDRNGTPIAVLHVFAAHAVVSAGPGVISGDYPGAAMRAVEKQLGGETVALFLQGCGGNLSPVPRLVGQSPAAVERAGRIFAERAAQILESSMRPLTTEGFAFGVRQVKLPLVPLNGFGSLEALEQAFIDAATTYQARRAQGLRGRYEPMVALADRLTLARNVEAWSRYEISALRFGSRLSMVFLPGEAFIEQALELRERIGTEYVFVAAYNDSTPVYIPNPVAFEEGGYEVGPWCYSTPETGKVMVEAALELARSLEP